MAVPLKRMLQDAHLYSPHPDLRTLTGVRASFYGGHNKQTSKTLKNRPAATNRQNKSPKVTQLDV